MEESIAAVRTSSAHDTVAPARLRARVARKFGELVTLFARLFRSAAAAEREPADYPFAASDIAQLHRIRRDPQAAALDAQTWTGLLLGEYVERLTGQVSIFGKQVLHQRLVDGLDDGARELRAERVRALIADKALLEQLDRVCRPLRHADTEIAGLLFETGLPVVPRWAGRSEHGDVDLEDAVHPLLAQPAALSIGLRGKGGFFSGQNGIGKSTLLRTVGLNLVVARAFGFCYASRASVPMLPVVASMQSEDSLLGGESLYIAELARARELLAMAAGGQRATLIIDEIFRGTNHLESVSAAAAVLDVLASHDTVLVSSHNLVLASLLEHRLAPFCVALDETGVLTLAPGLLTHTNGIALLAQRGFGEKVEANAARVFDWLSAYLAQPGGGGMVLAALPAAAPAPALQQA
jgi:hypothetical protein